MGGVGENNLSFIETSALDASNVELAFQNILTGKIPLEHCLSHSRAILILASRNLPNRLPKSARQRRFRAKHPRRRHKIGAQQARRRRCCEERVLLGPHTPLRCDVRGMRRVDTRRMLTWREHGWLLHDYLRTTWPRNQFLFPLLLHFFCWCHSARLRWGLPGFTSMDF